MSRFAREHRVFFVEEPVYDGSGPALKVSVCPKTGVHVVTPQLKSDGNPAVAMERILAEFVSVKQIENPVVCQWL